MLPNCQFKTMPNKSKTKSIRKDDKKALLEPFTKEETVQMAIERVRGNKSVKTALNELTESQLPSILLGNEVPEAASANMNILSLAHSLESGHALLESVDDRYKPFALEIKKSLEQEFACEKPSERMLVDQIVNAHLRKLEYTRLMVKYREQEWLSQEKVAVLNFYSKEADRAHRQFISALETLKAIKQPPINVNVKAQNAFVAQNQQFNNHSEQINEAK